MKRKTRASLRDWSVSRLGAVCNPRDVSWVRRIRHVIVALAFFGAGAAVRAEEAPAPLRVMSFNIRFDTPADGEDAWPEAARGTRRSRAS